MRTIIYYLIITVLLLSCSNNNTTNVPTINLNEINLTPSLLQSNYGKYFEDYGATFLENTETFKTSQIKQIISIDSTVYIIHKTDLVSYNYLSGKQNNSFMPPKGDYLSLDVSEDGKIYALEGTNSLLRCLDLQGDLIYEIPLKKDFKYESLVLLDSLNLLVCAISFPTPVTYVVNLQTKEITPFDKPTEDSFVPESDIYSTFILHYTNLYFFSKTKSGDIIGKYIFDEQYYYYTKEGKKPFARITENKRLKYKSNIHTYSNRQKHYIPKGLWQIDDNMRLLSWQRPSYNDPKGYVIRKFTLLANDMTFYSNNPYFFTRNIYFQHPTYDTYNLGGNMKYFIYPNTREIFKPFQLSDKGVSNYAAKQMMSTKLLPKDMSNLGLDKNLILCYYKINDTIMPVSKNKIYHDNNMYEL